MMRAPPFFAMRMAASVSAVSPDLAYDDEDIVRVEDRVAVAEFARDVDVDRNAREVLEGVLADDSGVPGGSARGDDDAASLRP